MATGQPDEKVNTQAVLKSPPKRVAITTVVSEFDSFGSRYRLRDLLSSDKGEDKER